MVRVIDRRRAAALLLLLRIRRARRQRTTRRWWVHPINQRRQQYGAYYTLVRELRLDSEKHLTYFRMSAEQMDALLAIVGPDLTRQSTNYRQAIEPKQRLAVTIRFLATGESFVSLALQFRLGVSTVSQSVHMTCAAIENRMTATTLPPLTQQRWKAIASEFWQRWRFPNCIGALDGKHITITQPARSGSLFHNYKNTFSIVLMALVDANYKFITLQVGDFGKTSDGGVFASSELGEGMEEQAWDVPPPTPLPASDELGPVPYVMVGDAAFPLKSYLMRPFPGRRLPQWRDRFNFRLSSARMVVECAFGILTARWRALRERLTLSEDHVDSVVMACCILHNYLHTPSQTQRLLEEAEATGQSLPRHHNMGGNRGSREAYDVREKFATFFNSPAGRRR